MDMPGPQTTLDNGVYVACKRRGLRQVNEAIRGRKRQDGAADFTSLNVTVEDNDGLYSAVFTVPLNCPTVELFDEDCPNQPVDGKVRRN